VDYWYPTQTPSNVLSTTQWVRDMPLSTFASSQISQALGTSLNPYLSKLTLISGLDHVVQLGHNSAAMLGNFDGGTPTIDQVLGKSSKIYPVEPAIRTLLLSDDYYPRSFSWDWSGGQLVELPSFFNPQAAFDRVFFASDQSKTSRYTKVVDLVYQDYLALKGNARLGSMDRAQLDSHMTYLSELQNRLKTMSPLTGSIPARPGTPSFGSSADVAAAYRALCDVMVAAIKCGATRLSNLRIATLPDINPSQWHGDSHIAEPNPNPTNLAATKWICDNIFAYLIQQLDVPEANGKTYLDNSLILWGNEISIGWVHDGYNTQVLMAGGLGGYLNTGRFIDYSQWGDATKSVPNETRNAGRPYNQLLVTILQGMGLVPTDYETNGRPGYGAASVVDAGHMSLYANNIADVGKVLPFLTTV
jgi:hypothetical protein